MAKPRSGPVGRGIESQRFAAKRHKGNRYTEVTGGKSHLGTDGTLPAKTVVTWGKKTQTALQKRGDSDVDGYYSRHGRTQGRLDR